MLFDWDHNKNRSNIKKHKVSFELATTVFDDPLHLSIIDQEATGEMRWITVGQAANLITLVVVHA